MKELASLAVNVGVIFCYSKMYRTALNGASYTFSNGKSFSLLGPGVEFSSR